MALSCSTLCAAKRVGVVMLQVSSTLEGVELGQFITKTHMGRMFRGVYNGEPVTIKVGLLAVTPYSALPLGTYCLLADPTHI